MGDKSTAVDLVQVLEDRNRNGRYDKLISEARLNHFHDLLSPLEIAEPKNYLAECLARYPELEDIRRDVINGLYSEIK